MRLPVIALALLLLALPPASAAPDVIGTEPASDDTPCITVALNGNIVIRPFSCLESVLGPIEL